MRYRVGLVVVLGCVAVGAGGQSDLPVTPDATQQRSAKTFVVKTPVVGAMAAAASKALTPLTARERVVQLLDRFTFGPRPGDVDRVMAMGEDKWVAQQLNPGSVPDEAYAKRVKAFATLTMPAGEALLVFPNQSRLDIIAQGKVPYPTDPLVKAVVEVQLAKESKARDQGKMNGGAGPTDAEKAAQGKADKATAERVAGELIALPKNERMGAFLEMPVEDRLAFSLNASLPADQRTLLFGEVSPREAEALKAMSVGGQSANFLVDEMVQGRVLRDVLSERQLLAVMTDFWFNHFNVYVPKDSDQWYGASYERDVIAKHALGSFRDLLLASAQSPAMMVYLDNWLSIGPDSLANGVDPRSPKAKRSNKGLNENYGREVMELHTVGVNGGYTQADVTALAAILTGWGVKQPFDADGFVFDPAKHEPGPKVWFGYLIEEDGKVTKLGPGVKRPAATFGTSETVATADSMKQGIAALNILAESPQTAHFIATLLAQYFVADKPPATLVDRLQKAYLASHGDIKTILRALIASPEFNSRQYYRNKVKTPEEYVASAFRATATEPQNLGTLEQTLKTMGMPLFAALPPTGYYLTADHWMNSSALVDRLNFAYALTNGKFPGQRFDAPKLLAMGLLTPSTAIAGSKGATSGTEVTTRVLEATIIGAPVSAKTNALIEQQVKAQPAGASATDTLNLLTALVMGAPEFQVR